MKLSETLFISKGPGNSICETGPSEPSLHCFKGLYVFFSGSVATNEYRTPEQVYKGNKRVLLPKLYVQEISLLDLVTCNTLHLSWLSFIQFSSHHLEIVSRSFCNTKQSFWLLTVRYKTVSSAYCGRND